MAAAGIAQGQPVHTPGSVGTLNSAGGIYGNANNSVQISALGGVSAARTVNNPNVNTLVNPSILFPALPNTPSQSVAAQSQQGTPANSAWGQNRR